jgi:hypothetical protein
MKQYNKVKCECYRCRVKVVATDINSISQFIEGHQHKTEGGQSFSLVPQEEFVQCGMSKAPGGWYCTRTLGHSGPCAAIPTPVME